MEPNKWLDNCINNSFKADYVSHHVFIFSSSLALSFVTVCASWITWVAKKRLKMQKTQSAQHVWFSSCSGVNSQSNRFLTGVHLQVTQTPSIRRSWTWVWLLCSHLAKDSQWAREPTRVGFKWMNTAHVKASRDVLLADPISFISLIWRRWCLPCTFLHRLQDWLILAGARSVIGGRLHLQHLADTFI